MSKIKTLSFDELKALAQVHANEIIKSGKTGPNQIKNALKNAFISGYMECFKSVTSSNAKLLDKARALREGK